MTENHYLHPSVKAHRVLGAWCLVLGTWCLVLGMAAKTPPRDLPETAEGTFVQRKVLADVDVTLVSKGTFRFGRDQFFEWNTHEPMPSTFYATPTNYSLTVNGKTTARQLELNVSSVEQLFSIREMKGFVKDVKARPETGFPTRVDVSFTNGDRLEIELARTR